MAPRPSSPPSAQLPPDVPNLPISGADVLADYLRRFALWCRHGFASKLDAQSAAPWILLQATDTATGAPTPFIYRVGVSVTVTGGVASAPLITLTLVPTGGG